MSEILIVEDDRLAAAAAVALFADAGYEVRLAKTAAKGEMEFRKHLPDVVLLDVMLPDGDGYGLCRRMREIDEFVPVVFNSALGDVEDVKRGLAAGGDDYVAKTATDEERLARVARAVSRYKAFMSSRIVEGSSKLTVGSATVDLLDLSVTDGGRAIAKLTRTEADILKLFYTRRGQIVPPDDIVAEIRGEGFACEDNMLYVHLHNLRLKLGRSGGLISSFRGKGYRLDW